MTPACETSPMPDEREAFMTALDRYEDAAIAAADPGARSVLIERLRMARRDVMARFDTVLERAGERVVA